MVRNELIQEILCLSAADREYVRDVVVASLADGLPPQLDAKDQELILQRIEYYRQHPEKLLSWDQVKNMLNEQRARRAS